MAVAQIKVKNAAPWWAVSRSNVFVYATVSNDGAINNGKDKYVIHSGPGACDDRDSAKWTTAGLIMSTRVSYALNNNLSTQRLVWASPYSVGFDLRKIVGNNVRQDFDYFKEKVDYNSLGDCQSAPTVFESDHSTACKISGGNIQVSSLPTYVNVIFVDGDLIIDGAIPHRVGVYDPGNTRGDFRAYIVSGDVIVKGDVGNLHSDIQSDQNLRCYNSNGTNNLNSLSFDALGRDSGKITLNGVFIVDGKITMEHDRSYDMPFNKDNSYCDRQLIVAGSLISWGGPLNINRTFKGCTLEKDDPSKWEDINAQAPSVVVLQDPEYIINAPSWMREVNSTRYEVR